MSGLFLRNFDEDACAFAGPGLNGAQGPEATETADTPRFSEADMARMIAEARAAAIAEGKAQGAADTRAEMQIALEVQSEEVSQSIRDELGAMSGRIDRQFRQMEQEMVELALGLAERLLPEILSAHGPDLLVSRIREGMTKARGNAALRIFVSPAMQPLIERAAERWKSQDFDHMEIVISADPALSDTSTRLNWKNGYFEYNLDRVCDELRGLLRQSVASLKDHSERVE